MHADDADDEVPKASRCRQMIMTIMMVVCYMTHQIQMQQIQHIQYQQDSLIIIMQQHTMSLVEKKSFIHIQNQTSLLQYCVVFKIIYELMEYNYDMQNESIMMNNQIQLPIQLMKYIKSHQLDLQISMLLTSSKLIHLFSDKDIDDKLTLRGHS